MLKTNLHKLTKSLAATAIFCLFASAAPVRAEIKLKVANDKHQTAYSSFDKSTKTADDFSSLNPGTDGDLVVVGTQVLNEYAVLATNVAAGSTSFNVTDITDLNSSLFGSLAPNDLLLIVQMQGASIDTSDTVNYGAVTALNGAGLYEFVSVSTFVGNTITINTTPAPGGTCVVGLRNSYSTAGKTQVIRVPQLNNLGVPVGASVVADPWDGARGGVVAVEVNQDLVVNGTINANGQGFRGGLLDNDTLPAGGVIYRSTLTVDGAEKGEGIAGWRTEYDALNGRYGRGAPANGGGGGNSHNGGGGGGANGNNGNAWTGQGVMPNTVIGAAAWNLDPGFIANGGLTNSAGGGRGGYTWSAADSNALIVGPGNAVWAGDSRREAGGLGGRPVGNDPATRLFMGGGGGAGDANNSVGGAGGNGGGLVIILARNATGLGLGNISANGQSGFSSTAATANDAPGGGGAGGSVVVFTVTLNNITLNANGGEGGNNQVPLLNVEAEGGGGGGGGGYIAIRPGQTVPRNASGEDGGISNSISVVEFPRNGATDGQTGQATATAITVPTACRAVTAAQVSVVGRVTAANGRGIGKAQISLTDAAGETRYALTNPFGYFRFNEISANQSVIVTVSAKRYRFDNPTQLVLANSEVNEVNFVAAP